MGGHTHTHTHRDTDFGYYNIDDSKFALEFICYKIKFKYNAFSHYTRVLIKYPDYHIFKDI